MSERKILMAFCSGPLLEITRMYLKIVMDAKQAFLSQYFQVLSTKLQKISDEAEKKIPKERLQEIKEYLDQEGNSSKSFAEISQDLKCSDEDSVSFDEMQLKADEIMDQLNSISKKQAKELIKQLILKHTLKDYESDKIKKQNQIKKLEREIEEKERDIRDALKNAVFDIRIDREILNEAVQDKKNEINIIKGKIEDLSQETEIE